MYIINLKDLDPVNSGLEALWSSFSLWGLVCEGGYQTPTKRTTESGEMRARSVRPILRTVSHRRKAYPVSAHTCNDTES
jgi:hypothetical protein